jgi:undecaprenyl-diphosphatase
MVVSPRSSRRALLAFVRRSGTGLVLVMVLVTGCTALIVMMQRGWQPLDNLDRGVASVLDRTSGEKSAVSSALSVLTALGGNAAMWWLATVTAAGMILRRQLRLAAFLVVTGLGALVLAPLVKMLVDWMPPDRPVPQPTEPGNAFPSGHAINAVVFYGALLLVFWPAIPRHLRRWTLLLVGMLIVAIGVGRAALGVQYASDIVGGWIVGFAWLAVTTYAYRRWRLDVGNEARPLHDGLEPEAASVLAPGHTVHMQHPGRAAVTLVVAAVAIGGVVLALGLLVGWAAPAFDEAVPRWFASHRSSTFDTISAVLGRPGNTQAIIAIGLVIAPLAIGCVHRWRPAVSLAVLMLGAFAIALGVGALVGRTAPDVPQLGADPEISSFPALPTAATVCLYGALAVILVPRTRPGGWLRVLTLAVVIVVPVGVAFSTVYRGAGRPLDILAAALLALLWLGAVTVALDPNVDLHAPRPSPALDTGTGDAGQPLPAGSTIG